MRIYLVIFCCFWGQLASAQLTGTQFSNEQSASSPAIIESHDTARLAVTVYPNDLAMVTEVRTLDVPVGVSEIRFHGVSDMILPETAILQSFEGLRLEGNFNSDLISRNALLQKAVGSIIQIRRIDPDTGKSILIDAELISATSDMRGAEDAVFKTEAGLEALYCSGLSESILFSKIPDELNPVPMLSMLVDSKEAGTKEITLSYLTQGLGWGADYRMDVTKENNLASLLGWLTLSNKTSKSFEDAELAVVAGQINRAQQDNSYRDNNVRQQTRRVYVALCEGSVRRYTSVTEAVVVQYASMPLGGRSRQEVSVKEATLEDLGDYKLYRAPQAVTLSSHQTKQIAFLLNSDVEFEKIHKRTVNIKEDPKLLTALKPMRVEYDIDNDKGGNLAQPLPAGTVRIMSETANGQTLFIGEDRVENLAVDLPFEVKVADSFLVTSSFDYEIVNKVDVVYLKLTATVMNATQAPITAEIEFSGLRANNIRNSGLEFDPEEALPTYRLQVAADSKEDLTLEIPLKYKN